MRLAIFIALACSSCSVLRVGWARVEWLDGRVVPVAKCTAHVDPEGDVVMVCAAAGKLESDLWWQSERRRANGGEL